MDADVAELVRADRLLEAAKISSDRGDPRAASLLFERACDWQSAAREALRAGDGPRGLDLALRAGDEDLARDAVTLVAADATATERTAAHLLSHGRPDWAARLFETAGRDLDAARAWERGGDMTRAAALFERAHEPAEAARALESALRRNPDDAPAALALGALLERFGKDEASLRALQRVPATNALRREALRVMLGPLHRLGLIAAARDAASELSALPAPADAIETGRSTRLARSAWLHGRYEVVRQVASSANARVLEARDRARGERVALKVYATGDGPTAAARVAFGRVEQDLRALQALDHPAIVPIREVDAAEGAVVMAWMAGADLEQAILKGALPPARAAEVAAAVLSALGEAHRIGIVHRDVKATNVLFDAAGAARLSDFGAAHAADASATVTAGDADWLAYQSPEQREGRSVTARRDLFAVGVLLSEMLVGRVRGPGAAERPRPSSAHSGLDARHDRIVASLLSRSPEGRPPGAFEAREMIRSVAWPGIGSDSGTRRPTSGASEAGGEGRIHIGPDGVSVDTWTGRRIECVPLSEEVVAQARVFAAAAGHAAVQSVLRVDRDGGFLWLAACNAPLDRPPTAAERASIQAAVDALVRAGADATRLDPSAVGIDESGSLVLLFAR